MKNVIFSFVLLLMGFHTQAQHIGVKGGLSWANLGYDRLSRSSDYVDATFGDGMYIALPFHWRLHKNFSVGTELGFSTRVNELNHRYVVPTNTGNELRTIQRDITTKVVSMPFDMSLHLPYKGVELVFTTGVLLAKNASTTANTLDMDTGLSASITLPDAVRNTSVQSAWSIAAGIHANLGSRVKLVTDLRFARTFGTYQREYQFNSAPATASHITTMIPAVGLMYRLRK
jgi:hypothetical protein